MRVVVLERLWYPRLTLRGMLPKLGFELVTDTRNIGDVYDLLNDGVEADLFLIDIDYRQDSPSLIKRILEKLPNAKVVIAADRTDQYLFMPSVIADNAFVLVRPYTEEKIMRLIRS